MGAISGATPVLPPHRFIGYWGGTPSDGNQRLQQLLRLWSAPSCQTCSPGKGPRTAFTPDWGVGYLGLRAAPILPQVAGRRLIAAGAAAGLLSDQGLGAMPDAWVGLLDDRLVLGREPFGRVPLYWLQSGGLLWFASHLQLLLPLCGDRAIDLTALYGYSCFSYVPAPLTPIAAIAAIPAGTEQTWRMDLETGRIVPDEKLQRSSWCYTSEQIQSEPAAIQALQSLLKQAIVEQVADLGQEPVGVFLSGGLDSAIVAALLVQAGLSVRAYTLDFATAGVSEVPYAEQVARFLQIPLTRVRVTPRQVRRALVPTVRALDLPFGDGVTVPLFLLAEAASQEVKVIFNGEGGDQLFAGWPNKPLIAASLYRGLSPMTQAEQADALTQQYLQTFHRLYGYEVGVFQPAVRPALTAVSAHAWVAAALDGQESVPFLHRLRRANLLLKGGQNIQPRATNLAVAHGLQVRSPFCNPSLTEWTFQLDGELLLQGACEKYILKRAVESWLPAEIVWRPKRGMGVPLTTWCQEGLWPDLGRWLNPARLRQEGIWHPDLASSIISGQLGMIQGRRIGEILWLLLIWQVWRETIAGVSTAPSSWDHPFWCPPWLALPYLRWLKER